MNINTEQIIQTYLVDLQQDIVSRVKYVKSLELV